MATSLDIKSLQAIVKLCVKSGVRSLKMGELELVFDDPQVTISQDSLNVNRPREKKKPVKAITDEEHDRQTKLQIEDEELSLREQQIAYLQLTNPLAAEEMIVNGELDDARDDDESESDE
jgi:hypothetical protein